jgi:hypothetical protein
MINDRTGFVQSLSFDLNNQPSAEAMELLSKEDKIFKYLNSLAHGQQGIARQFKQSAGDITQEDLQRAIFKLVDLNGEQGSSVELFTGQASIDVNDFANEYMNADGKGVSAVKHKYINIGGTSDAVARKAASTGAGTMLKLNADEILESGDSGLIASYRRSSLTQILKSSAAPSEDQRFINAIEQMYDSRIGAGTYREAFNSLSRESADRSITPMEFAIRVSGRMYKSSLESGEEELTMRS